MSNEKKKNSKYEEVIIKTILANEIFEKDFFNDNENNNWRDVVNAMYNEKGFDGDAILARFVISGSFEHHKAYETCNFIPTNINNEIDENIDKKFILKNDENKIYNKEDEEENSENLSLDKNYITELIED
jgi:hypothetical protein